MHLTVAFLGTVPVAAGPQLCERLVEALAGPAPRLRPGRPVARPSPRRAQLVAVELDDVDGVLADMAARVERVCGAVLSGYAADRRPFWPHVTVARFRRPGDVRRFPPIEHEHVFDITRASLYDSHITPGEPPRYEALKEVMLDGSFAERSPSHG